MNVHMISIYFKKNCSAKNIPSNPKAQQSAASLWLILELHYCEGGGERWHHTSDCPRQSEGWHCRTGGTERDSKRGFIYIYIRIYIKTRERARDGGIR